MSSDFSGVINACFWLQRGTPLRVEKKYDTFMTLATFPAAAGDA